MILLFESGLHSRVKQAKSAYILLRREDPLNEVPPVHP